MSSGTRHLTATIVGFVGALFVFAILFWSIDIEQFIAALNRIRPEFIGAILGLAVTWLLLWSFALRTVLGVLGVRVSVIKGYFLYASALFASNVTPFGQASGEPIAAAVIARSSAAEYELGFASLVSVDAIHFIPSLTFALVGLAYYATLVTVGQYIQLATIVVVALVGMLSLVFVLGWRYRYPLEYRMIDILTPLLRRLGHLVPQHSAPSPAVIERRIEAFFAALEWIATDRRGLVLAVGCSALGWLVQMGMLWLAFVALREPIAFSVLLFVVPIANVGKLPLLARSVQTDLAPGGRGFHVDSRRSVLGIGRGPSSVIVPRAIRTSTGASPLSDFCRERSRWYSLRAYRSPMFFAAL